MNAAAKALLLTSVGVLSGTGVFYVIAGGWAPVLFEPTHPFLSHPGTRDVDVLLLDDPLECTQAAEALIRSGFHPSAKHEFQLLRGARVSSKQFIFNVDLMHPLEGSDASDLFRDLFDLEVREQHEADESRHVKSIALPSSSLIAEHSLYDELTVGGIDLDGAEVALTVPVITPVGSILSKCASVAQPKRPRDAFDIYYMLTSNGGEGYAAELRALVSEVPAFDKELAKLRKFLEEKPEQFERNVEIYSTDALRSAGMVRRLISRD